MPDILFTCQCRCCFMRWKRDGEAWEHECPKCKATVYDALGPQGMDIRKSYLRLPGDQYDYISPLDNSHISSKRQHHDHMKRHGVIELGNEKPDLKPFKATVPREETKREMRNQLERMKAHGLWRER